MNASAPQLYAADYAGVEEKLPPSIAANDGYDRSQSAIFPELKPSQCAGLGDAGWQTFDSLDAAREYARQWVAIHLAKEYKIYDVYQQLVKTVMNGQPRGDLHAAWQASRPKSWWQFWQ